MDHQQIEIVDVERLQAFVNRAREVRFAQVLVRHLGGEEDVAARHARGAHRLADLALGAVLARGVDVAIAGFERSDDLFSGERAGLRRGAEAERGDVRAVGAQSGHGMLHQKNP